MGVLYYESQESDEFAVLSTIKAEYMTLSEACKESLCLRCFLNELLPGTKIVPTNIMHDNQSAQKLL